jgi:hypothetical protein
MAKGIGIGISPYLLGAKGVGGNIPIVPNQLLDDGNPLNDNNNPLIDDSPINPDPDIQDKILTTTLLATDWVVVLDDSGIPLQLITAGNLASLMGLSI